MKSRLSLSVLIIVIATLALQSCQTTAITSTLSKTPSITLTQNTAGTPTKLISTQPVSDNNNVVLILSIYSQLPNPILIKFGQKLTVVPPVGWGEYGWDLIFDDSFFQLDKDNEPKWPSQGWWVWIPLKTGKSTISIKAKPLPCQNSNPPCDFPEYFVNLNIEVSP